MKNPLQLISKKKPLRRIIQGLGAIGLGGGALAFNEGITTETMTFWIEIISLITALIPVIADNIIKVAKELD